MEIAQGNAFGLRESSRDDNIQYTMQQLSSKGQDPSNEDNQTPKSVAETYSKQMKSEPNRSLNFY